MDLREPYVLSTILILALSVCLHVCAAILRILSPQTAQRCALRTIFCGVIGLAEKSEKLWIMDWSVGHEYIYFQVERAYYCTPGT